MNMTLLIITLWAAPPMLANDHCPKLFSIVFPDHHKTNGSSPERVWVTIDGLGKVVSIDDERPACKGGIST